MRAHILIARQDPNAAIYGRADWDGPRWRPAFGVSSSLPALIDGALHSVPETNITISPRDISYLMARGTPDNLNCPSSGTVQILCPLGQAAAPHDHWTLVLMDAERGLRQIITKHRFVARVLPGRLKDQFFTTDAIAEMVKRHHAGEIWIRHDWTASELCPDQVEPYEQKSTLAPPPRDTRTPVQREADKLKAKRKAASTKKQSQRSVAAMEFTRQAAEEHGKRVVAEIEADEKKAKAKKKRG
jgi:hypothetical protein